MLLWECYLRIYLKYRTTLNLKKCNFLRKRFEFVGHDILPEGNTTAKSKYDLISDWKLPTTGDGLHSFISLCNFYTKFLPLFEMKVGPLRLLYSKYLHQQIPKEEWTEDLKRLFSSLKNDLTSEPVLARYDSSKPVFLKTDWSSLGMSFILMQPSDDAVSTAAIKKLVEHGVCDYDKSANSPRLRAVSSGMRKCTEGESHYHSFVGEIAALRWAISKNKLYLWGVTFYVLCDMKSTYRILEYDGPIHSLRRWCQELQCYHFVAFHRPAKMMADVDALNRGPYHRMTTTYYTMVTTIRAYDLQHNAAAYNSTIFDTMLTNKKTNLRKIRDWSLTATHSLHAALLLVEVASIIQSNSVQVSTILNSMLCKLHAAAMRSSVDVVHALPKSSQPATAHPTTQQGVAITTTGTSTGSCIHRRDKLSIAGMDKSDSSHSHARRVDNELCSTYTKGNAGVATRTCASSESTSQSSIAHADALEQSSSKTSLCDNLRPVSVSTCNRHSCISDMSFSSDLRDNSIYQYSTIDPINDGNTTSKIVSNNMSNTIGATQSIGKSSTTEPNPCNDNISLPTGILEGSSLTTSRRNTNASVCIDS
jgi:hypothetical protein